MEFDEEIKKRFKMVYVPNWFSVDLKTGVSDSVPAVLRRPFYFPLMLKKTAGDLHVLGKMFLRR